LKTRYLIIGNSAGGIAAAEAIREVDRKGTMAIISDEPYPAYSRPLIAKYLTHERTLEGMLFRAPDFYKDNGIDLLTGNEVIAIDFKARTATLTTEEVVYWQKLLLATGGQPIMPLLKGMDKLGVFSFITLNDAKAIDEYLHKVRRVVVIGGGLIGTSVTDALVKRGVNVSVIEMKERMLNMMLDETASTVIEEAVCRAGVNIITGHTVDEISGNGTVCGVILDDGSQVPCEMVVVAIGVTPRVELLKDSEMKINKGIVVDQRMNTNLPDVYSCGDVAEAHDFVFGMGRLTPIWPNAYIGGRVAGHNMAGKEDEYGGGTGMNALNYFGLDIVSAGLVSPPNENGYEVYFRRDGAIYRKVVIKNGKLVGMVFIGDIETAGIVFGLMRDRVNVNPFKKSMVDDNFGLIALPRRMRQKKLKVPLSHGEHLMTIPEPMDKDVADE
jgi:NAD(P)H-nitrite reductase large subunit